MAKVNLDIAPRLDIVCKRGDSFKLVVDFQTPMPTTNTDYILKVAEDSESTPLAGVTFSYDVTNGEASNSKLTITTTADIMDIEPGLYVYDLQVEDTTQEVFQQVASANYEATLLYGTFRVNDDVSAT